MRRAAGAAAVGALGVAALSGCGGAEPAAIAGVGIDGDGYFAVVVMCDQGRSLTYAQFEVVETGEPALAWIGRTVEPITYYRVATDPPDNWVVDIDGGLVTGVAYRFVASAGDLSVTGPEFDLDDLAGLGGDEVFDADGAVRTTEEFLASCP